MSRPGPFEIDPRHRQHLARLVDAERLFDARRQNLEHAAGTGADVEQIARVGAGDDVDERRLDLALVDIERADAMPIGGVLTKIGGGEVGALPLDRAKPLQVERDRRISFVARRHQLAGEHGRRARSAQPVKHPAAFAKAIEQARLAQQL